MVDKVPNPTQMTNKMLISAQMTNNFYVAIQMTNKVCNLKESNLVTATS